MGKQQNFFHFSKQISSLLLFSFRPRWNQHHETRHVKQEFNSQSQPLPWPWGSSHKRQLSRLRSQNTRQGNNTLAQELFPRSLTVENVKGKITCSVSADKLEIKTEKGGERKKNWCIRRATGLNYVTDQIYWLPRESTIDQLLPFI